MFMLTYNYITLRGESRLRPQYLLLYGSHFAVIPVEASPSKFFIFFFLFQNLSLRRDFVRGFALI